MNIGEIHQLVREGRAIKGQHYHPGKRGIGFAQILLALERCIHVEKDGRTEFAGRPIHPNGWFAIANVPGRRRLRVDFDLWTDEQGRLLLIVTAYHV